MTAKSAGPIESVSDSVFSDNNNNTNDDTGFVKGYGVQRFISLADVSGSLYGNIVTANS